MANVQNTERETASIRVNIDVWRDLTALKRAPGDDFNIVIRRLLDERNGASKGSIPNGR